MDHYLIVDARDLDSAAALQDRGRVKLSERSVRLAEEISSKWGWNKPAALTAYPDRVIVWDAQESDESLIMEAVDAHSAPPPPDPDEELAAAIAGAQAAAESATDVATLRAALVQLCAALSGQKCPAAAKARPITRPITQ